MPSVMARLAITESLSLPNNFIVTPPAVAMLSDAAPSRMVPPCPAADRPDLLDHREQKSGGQPEQQHPVECLQGTHHLPVRFQKDICVTIGCYCAERIEHGRLVVGQRAEEPVGSSPDGSLNSMQNGRQQSRRTHNHCKSRREMAS